MNRLSDEDMLWLAERIHEHRRTREGHPGWAQRLDGAIDLLIWSASVDGRDGDRIVQDGWVQSGQRLTDVHFRNAPATDLAREAFDSGALKQIKREHVVPRSALLRIVLKTSSAADTKRVLSAYSCIALVHETECKRLRPAWRMPSGWDDGVDWAQLPAVLPDPWRRYSDASPPVLPKHHDGQTAY